jgi:hypothetical protein
MFTDQFGAEEGLSHEVHPKSARLRLDNDHILARYIDLPSGSRSRFASFEQDEPIEAPSPYAWPSPNDGKFFDQRATD